MTTAALVGLDQTARGSSGGARPGSGAKHGKVRCAKTVAEENEGQRDRDGPGIAGRMFWPDA